MEGCARKSATTPVGTRYDSNAGDDEEHKVYDPAAVREEIAKEKTPQRKELSPVNHSQIAYPLFTKNLYVQVSIPCADHAG